MKDINKRAEDICIKIFKETPLKKVVYSSKNIKDAWNIGKELSYQKKSFKGGK